MGYLLREQQAVMTGCPGTSSLLCKHSMPPAFSALSPPSSPYFFHGVPTIPQSVKSQYFLATKNYFRSPGDTGSNLKSFLSQQLASSLLLRQKMPGNYSSS